MIINTTDKLLIKLENFLNGFSAIAIFVLMLTAAVQVVSRKVFNLPIPGYIDIAEQSIAIFAFLSIAYCQRLGGHVRMEIFLSAMKGRSKWVSEAIQTSASILIISILMYFSFKHFQRAWVFGDSTIDIGLPTWPSKLMIPGALATLNLRLLIHLAGYIRLAIDPELEPIGVPLIKDVVEQAEEEAAQIELIK